MIRTASAVLEKLTLVAAFHYLRLTRRRGKQRDISWVVGAREVASMVHQISAAIPESYSVSYGIPSFYEEIHYDKTLPEKLRGRRGPIVSLRRFLFAPFALAEFALRAHGVMYVGPRAYLQHVNDEREYEIRFLKSHGVRVALYWCGSDIRSTVLMHELERETGMPNIFTYIGLVAPSFESAAYERSVRTRARISDTFADIVFNNPVDHRGYVTRYSEPFYYFIDDGVFDGTEDKFSDLSRIVVTHAATSPVIKGTQLVRSAVKRLQEEGYDFEYTEMLDASHDEVMSQLRRTHISLNQFYGFTPAVYGVESLAARCAVLQSADRTVETTLAPGANDAWVVTKHFEVYDNLKKLLDNPRLIEPQANRGRDWASAYCSATATGEILRSLLTLVVDGRYDRDARSTLPEGAAWSVPEAVE
jgi:hypothetical protein